MRKIIRTIIIFWGILTLFPLLYIVYFYISTHGSFYYYIDGEASAIIWRDENANGLRDEGEKGIPYVCIWEGSPERSVDYIINHCKVPLQNHSDDNGEWSRFLPGGTCEDTYLFVEIPTGYQPTTNLASNACDAKFGFAPNNVTVTQQVQSIEQFVQQYKVTLWIKRIAIGFTILLICIIGTIWLQREPKKL